MPFDTDLFRRAKTRESCMQDIIMQIHYAIFFALPWQYYGLQYCCEQVYTPCDERIRVPTWRKVGRSATEKRARPASSLAMVSPRSDTVGSARREPEARAV